MSIIINNTPIRIPDLLLPNKNVDLHTWSVIACDQFTSDPQYWESVQNIVGDSPSTLNLILPEVFLHTPNIDDAFQSIKEYTKQYMTQQIFDLHKDTLLIINRKVGEQVMRRGIMVQVDLAMYEPDPDQDVAIKSTEAIITSRLPKRIQVRKSTSLDLSHILMLYSDASHTLIDTLNTHIIETAYNTHLMKDGGEVTASICDTTAAIKAIQQFFDNATKAAAQNQSHAVLAVGDGNHSLMAAKQVWIDNGAKLDDPERWVLVELINIFEEGLSVEPIHRILFNAQHDAIINLLKTHGILSENNTYTEEQSHNTVKVITKTNTLFWTPHHTNKTSLAVEALEALLQSNTHCYKNIDFIHDSSEITMHTHTSEQNMGFIFSAFPREAIFDIVHRKKLFPRKSFSLGQAEAKRYYIEACLRDSSI